MEILMKKVHCCITELVLICETPHIRGKSCIKRSLTHSSALMPKSAQILIQAPGLSHITRRKVTSPNGIARWRKVTSHGGKSHHFATIPMAQRHSTENRKVTKSSRDIAHSEIFVDFRKKFASNTNGTACAI